MMKTKILKRLLLLLLLMTVGISHVWGWGETVYYLQNYNTSVIDWSTSVSDRFTPIIVNDGGNLYLAGDPTQTYNNGATLTGPDMQVPAGADFVLTFDLKLGNSNDQKPKFWIKGADGNDMFTIEAQYTNGNHPWIINEYQHVPISLTGTQYLNTNTINDRPWNHFKLTYKNGTLHLNIKDAGNNNILDNDIQIINSTGGMGRLMFWSGKALAKFAIDNIRATSLFSYDSPSATVPLTMVGTSNHPVISGLPSIINETGTIGTITYSSSNTSVAQVDASGNVYLVGTGNTGITATMGNYSTSYELIVTGSNATTSTNTSVSYGYSSKTWSLTGEGVMPRGGTANLGAITMSYGLATEMGVVVNDGGTYVMKVIDGNGWSHAAVNTTTHLPENPSYKGTIYTFIPVANGTLTINGKFSKPRMYNSDGTELLNNDNYVTSVTVDLIANNVYYFYCEPYERAFLSSFSYTFQAYIAKSYDVVPSTQSSYEITAVEGLSNPTYTILATAGEIAMSDVYMSGNTINGFSGKPGAVKVRISEGGADLFFTLTIAYPATDYPGHQWNFCTDVDANGNEVQRQLDIADNLKTAPGDGATVYDSNGDEWRGVIGNRNRWVRTKAVNGDNAFIVKETNGLVFNTVERGFFVRNDASEYTHIGIRHNGTSFTIPALKADDIVEIMWRHENSSSGSVFTATNVKDLRGKDINEEFLITESAQRGDSKTRFVGYYSFIVKEDGNVTFTLADIGNCDLQSIRIYKGPYRSTMREIELSGNNPAPTTMLLDNAEQSYTYNYCNQLYSTATGPAIYVLKGYRPYAGSGVEGVDYDNVGCVTGTNAALSPSPFVDEDAYPVSDAEKVRLYELRKNLVGLAMYNQTWQSSNNSYNNGVIRATSGWGKVTIRMNNYTNDMKYLIGYTPDYTLTIGSAPHQKYPYTWDFTKIAGGSVTGEEDNVLYSIEAEGSNASFSGEAPTNWIKKGNGLFTLNTDNSDDLGSQYVPGAVLVTQDRALSYFNGVDYESKCAKDELDGLGFDGAITMHVDHLPSNVSSGWNRAAVADMREPMLSFRITDYATFTKTGETDDGEPIGTWSNPATLKEAGNGWVQINNHVSIDESSIPSGGIGFRLDGGNTKYIHVMPSSTLQAGDVISVTAYNAYSNRDAGISFNKSASTSDVAQSLMLTGRLVEETLNYTIATNDGLDGRSDFYLYMNTNTVHITAIEITRSASAVPDLDWSIYTLTNTTITVPDLNADGKQDWIYVSATEEPTEVTNAVKVDDEAIGSVDANTDVYKYKVTAAGNAYITFPAGTKIYKIGVTHILKTMHPVGNIGWATESRDHSIDHQLTGYFTINDANAYTVTYDSYDLNTATVALTPINEAGHVPANTGIVLRQDNNVAADNYQVPLFYPSYTHEASTIPADNMMVPVVTGERQYLEVNSGKQKFILTNVHWTYTSGSGWGPKIMETDAAGFYRLHVWGDEEKDRLPNNCAYLGVPEGELPVAVWNAASPSRQYSIAIRDTDDAPGDDPSVSAIDNSRVSDVGTEPVYTLDGRRLAAPPARSGVYISGGKKILLK